MSEPMERTRTDCIYCGVDHVPSLNGHICNETDWMQHTENLHNRIAALDTALDLANHQLIALRALKPTTYTTT